MTFSKNNERHIKVYNDANWGGDIKTAKSTSGTIIMINNNPITWKSQKQKCISRSSMESAFVGKVTRFSAYFTEFLCSAFIGVVGVCIAVATGWLLSL